MFHISVAFDQRDWLSYRTDLYSIHVIFGKIIMCIGCFYKVLINLQSKISLCLHCTLTVINVQYTI